MVFPFFKSKDREKQKTDPLLAAGLKGERSSNPQVSIKLAEHFLRENKRELAVDEYLHAAQAFLEKRQTQLAMAVYRNIITIDPDRYSVYETLADLYLKTGFPGDGASVLLALAYQYKKAGCDSEVKRTLDSVLEFAPDNPVLKRKVQAFLAADGKSGTVAAAKAPESGPAAAAQKPPAPVPVEPPVAKSVSPAAAKAPETGPAAAAQKPPAPVPVEPPVVKSVSPAAAKAPETGPAAAAQKPPVPAGPPAQPFFDLQSALTTAASPEQKSVLAQPKEPESAPEPSPQSAFPAKPTQVFFDLQSALETDVEPGQKSVPAQPGESASKPAAPAQQQEPDETVRSFFDLQSALAADASLGFDYDASSENLSSGDQEGSPFSVLNVVKNIALQDPKQDTPQFHLNLGIAYMQCGDYEQAVDELLSALYGIPDKIGCYARLAECSLKLQRRELACGFLREALDCPEISPEQVRKVKKRLDELSAV